MSHTLESFYGDGKTRSFNSGFTLASGEGRNQRLVPLSGGLVVTLPDARYFGQAGGPIFYLLNYGAFAFDVEDQDSNFVASVPAGEEGVLLLSDVSEASGHYHLKIRTYTDPQTPTPSASSSGSASGSASGTVPITFETQVSNTVVTGPS